MQQEGAQARGPNGEIATFRGGQWVVEAQGQPQGESWNIQPMQSPADRRAEQDQAWQAEDRVIQRANEARRLELAERSEARQASQQDGTFEQTFQRERAKNDAARYEGAMTGWREAGALEGRGNLAISMLDRGAPTGPMADMRIGVGKAVGGALGFLPGVPTREQTQLLEQVRNLGSQGALGDVGQLKGPLSEKELAFIQRLQIDPNATAETNRMVAETMRWTARRQAAYGAALDRWTRDHGAPSAAAPNGQTFDAWWGQYAAQALPRPGTPEAAALSAWQSQNPGREAVVTTPDQTGYDASAPVDQASGQRVSRRGVFNPETGQIEWQ